MSTKYWNITTSGTEVAKKQNKSIFECFSADELSVPGEKKIYDEKRSTWLENICKPFLKLLLEKNSQHYSSKFLMRRDITMNCKCS